MAWSFIGGNTPQLRNTLIATQTLGCKNVLSNCNATVCCNPHIFNAIRLQIMLYIANIISKLRNSGTFSITAPKSIKIYLLSINCPQILKVDLL